MTLYKWAFVCSALMVFAQGCSPSSANSNPPAAQNPSESISPSNPRPPIVRRGTTLEGRWMSVCHQTKDNHLDVRSLSWSIEISRLQVKQTEYNFKDAACKNLVASKTRVAETIVTPANDGTDAKISWGNESGFVLVSYYQSSDTLFSDRQQTSWEKRRLDESSAEAYTRSDLFPFYPSESVIIAKNGVFGKQLGQKLTYLHTTEMEDKRPDSTFPFHLNTTQNLMWFEVVTFNNQLDVYQTSGMTWDSTDYWSRYAGSPQDFILKAQWTDIQNECKGGRIQTLPAPWDDSDTRACVIVDPSQKLKKVTTIGRHYIGLSETFEFQNDQNFRNPSCQDSCRSGKYNAAGA